MRRSPITKWTIRGAALALLTLLLSPIDTPASAATGDLACTGNFQFNFTPPLTATTTTAHAEVSGGLVDCLSLNGQYTRLTSGYRTGVGSVTRPLGTLPCVPLMTITEDAVLYWNTGEQSLFHITVNTDPTVGPVTISAYFTEGPLAGDTANAYPIVLHPNLDCAVNGLSSLTSDLLEVLWD